MRILAISDTHLGEADERLAAILDRCGKGADLIVHAGDYTSSEVVDYLDAYPFAGVAGNMDPPGIHQRLPQKRVIRVRGFKVGLIHGFGFSSGLLERVAEQFSSVDAVVFGHSHSPLVKVVKGIFFLNPGSPFSPRHRGRGTVGVLNVNAGISAEIVEVEGCR